MTLLEQIKQQILQLPPAKQREVLDFAIFLQMQPNESPQAEADTERGQRIKLLLTRLSQMQTFAEIIDPSEWQRQIRQDRTLPGRDK